MSHLVVTFSKIMQGSKIWEMSWKINRFSAVIPSSYQQRSHHTEPKPGVLCVRARARVCSWIVASVFCWNRAVSSTKTIFQSVFIDVQTRVTGRKHLFHLWSDLILNFIQLQKEVFWTQRLTCWKGYIGVSRLQRLLIYKLISKQ